MTSNVRRAVRGLTVVSDSQPAVEVDLVAGAAYVDRLQFVLYDVARVDAFVFAAAGEGHAPGLLVVQFEGYLESNDHSYEYAFADTILLGGRRFHVDTAVADLVPRPPPESDMGRVLELLGAHGYPLGDRAVVVRFVHLPDAARRHELLILYAEPADAGPTGADLEEAVRERALASFRVRFPGSARAPDSGPT